jgi:hypothetical protein
MDTIIWRKIARSQDQKSIRQVKKQISIARLNALHSHGFLRSYLFREANQLERNLNCLLTNKK